MEVEHLDEGLHVHLVVVLNDGSHNIIPTQRVHNYSERGNCGGVGVQHNEFVRQLERDGEVRIAHTLDRQELYGLLRKEDVARVYTMRSQWGQNRTMYEIRPPKKGLAWLAWKLTKGG